MKWELTIHGGEDHGKRIIFEAETVEDARRRALQEIRERNAMVYELSKAE
jgi:hypothetical protein